MTRNALDPERYRGYLTLLARTEIGEQYQAQISPSDVVNETMFEAARNIKQFRGHSENAFSGWLRQILTNNLRDAFRRINASKRGGRRPAQSFPSIEESNAHLESLVAPDTSPSERVVRGEDLVRLSDAIERLPDMQRRVVELFHVGGLPASEVAKELGKTEGAVAGLLHRALGNLRREMGEQ